MVSYRFDLYPRDDPRDGTLIRSLVPELVDEVLSGGLQQAAYRAEANGASTGKLAVRSTTLAGQAIDPRGLQYVRVVELPGGTVRGGFFLEKGKFGALTEDEDSLLEFSGTGTLAYLSRSVMAPHTYLDTAIGTDPIGGNWSWGEQGPAAGGDFLGAALWRVIYEAQHFRVALTEHRHADGVIYTDSHDDDRLSTAIPDLVMTFDQYEDSSGNAWTIPSGDLKSRVGENVLSVVHRLMEAGLYVEMDPDTFELNAWEQQVHRAMLDATGSAWATDVVRFQAPIVEALDTGNIKDDAERNIQAYIKRSAMWAGGNSTYGFATEPSAIPWEGFYRAELDDAEALEAAAAEQLRAIGESGDTLKLRLWMEDDPANGKYLPFEHVKLDQAVTVHTGSDQWEFDEATYPVAAMTLQLRKGGGWDCIVELGRSYMTLPSPPANGPVPPAVPDTVGACLTDDSTLKYGSVGGGGNSPYKAFDCNDATAYGSSSATTAGQYLARDYEGVITASAWRILQATDLAFRASHLKIYGTNNAAAWAAVSGSPYSWPVEWVEVADVAIAPGESEGTFPEASYRYWAFQPRTEEGGGANGWTVYSMEIGSSGDITLPPGAPTPGTPGTYAPISHVHPPATEADADPTVDDDSTQGFAPGSLWVNTTDDTAWLLVDDAEGAAEWIQLQASLSESEVQALIDDAIAAHAAEPVSRWSPVTTWDGTHWIMVVDGNGTPVLTEV